MNELIKINKSIAELQKKAKLLMYEGRADVIQEICAQMAAYDITVKDIDWAVKGPAKKGARMQKVGTKSPVKKGSSAKVIPKYHGPEGQSWTGRGLTPKWMKTLLDAGQSKEDFLISAAHPPLSQ